VATTTHHEISKTAEDTARDPLHTARATAQTAQQTARDTQRTAAEETARVIETTAPKNGSFPIADYDEKMVGEITTRLDALTDEQLKRVKDYERRTKNRETLLQQIERRIQRAS
jgi:hypothetical protein